MSEPAKTTRRRFAVAALAMVTIAAACSDSSPDTDASVTNDAGNTPDVHSVDAVPDVPGDSQQSIDASDGAATSDAADASDDATASDASGDVDMGDAADASSDDASTDASDASDDASDASDAAPLDAGKGCKGIFCMVGHTCCNNIASVNYGKCELTTCTTCCM